MLNHKKDCAITIAKANLKAERIYCTCTPEPTSKEVIGDLVCTEHEFKGCIECFTVLDNYYTQPTSMEKIEKEAKDIIKKYHEECPLQKAQSGGGVCWTCAVIDGLVNHYRTAFSKIYDAKK